MIRSQYLVLLTFIIPFNAIACGGNPASVSSALKEKVPEPLRVVLFAPRAAGHDCGVLSPGAKVVYPLVVVNEADAAVALDEVVTSCECLSVSLSSQKIGAGGSVSGTVIIDLSKEPNSRGGLCLLAEAHVAGNPTHKAFTIRLDVDVR